VACLNFDPDFLDQRGGQYTTRTNNHCVVGQIDQCAILIDHHIGRFDFLDIGFKQHRQATTLFCFLGQLPVFWFDSTECVAAVAERYLGAGFNANRQRCISSADHQHLLAPVLFRIDQAIHHFFQVFPRHVKFAWRTAPSD
jgi:hypothetical protein